MLYYYLLYFFVTVFAKMILAMQLSLKGTPCLYQGDELAFTEADVPYELIQDPYGITFWPEFKGRDGCRTPMPWDDSAQAGFSDGKPWLPMPEHFGARSVGARSSRVIAPQVLPLSAERKRRQAASE